MRIISIEWKMFNQGNRSATDLRDEVKKIKDSILCLAAIVLAPWAYSFRNGFSHGISTTVWFCVGDVLVVACAKYAIMV